MLTIHFSPTSLLFTAQLPAMVSVSTDAASVCVEVECGQDTVFSTTLYPYEGIATLYDIRSVIEGYMQEHSLVVTPFIIQADTDTSHANTPERYVVFSALTLNITASDFIQTAFLTTMSAYTIPRSARQMLSFILPADATLNRYTECLVQVGGEAAPRIVRLDDGTVTAQNVLSKISAEVSPSQILSRLGIKGRLLSFTVHCGMRAKTFYVTDAQPDITLAVTNEFNCPEFIHLACVTKRKLDLNRSTAVCLGTSTFYDDDSAFEYEVESAMLTYEEVCRFSTLLLSHTVMLMEDGTDAVPIIITDIGSEISDADNATNSLKFKWKYATPRLAHLLPVGNNIFDAPFHRTFD